MLGGASDSSGSETLESEATTFLKKRFESVIEMRDAYIEGGGACTEWEVRDLTLATSSGACNSENVLSTYSSRAVADEQNRILRDFYLKLFPSGVNDEIHLLVGENWILNDSDKEMLSYFQEQYGGDLFTSYSQLP